MAIPLLFFSDAVGAQSGLARITRDICLRVNKHLPGLFRVASIGYGSAGSSKLPWQQYHWTFRDDYVIGELPEVWYDFAGDQRGIFLTVHDASRMLWLARPDQGVDARQEPKLYKFLQQRPFLKVGYFPIDASGINGKFCMALAETYKGYDRVLAYTKWAEQLLLQTLGAEESRKRALGSLPHGIDTSVFYPRPRQEARLAFRDRLIGPELASRYPLNVGNKLCIGIVATNQSRKDYGLGIEAVAKIAKTRDVLLWIHTDVPERQWSIPGLLQDFGLTRDAFLTVGHRTDEDLAQSYSACDVTICPGLGEGFCFPAAESLACGCPIVAGDTAAIPEFAPENMLCPPVAYRIESPYSIYRPVYSAAEWADKVLELTAQEQPMERKSLLPPELDWNGTILWPAWEKWFEALYGSMMGASAVQAAGANLIGK
jgi:glycosyltransferase involved in cell wall biosynthesis